MPDKINEKIYFIKGMHCASCEMVVEREMLGLKGVRAVDASTKDGKVIIEYDGAVPSAIELNKIFKTNGYVFYDQPDAERVPSQKKNILTILGVSLGIIIVFLILNVLGISSLVNVTSRSALPVFFFFGIIAGFSSCAALVGGIILSMSKQWLGMYSFGASTFDKLKPHFIFNAGRLISYGFFGGLLGAIGSKISLSPNFGSALVIIVSIVMFFLALQMLGVKQLQKFQISMPKFIIRGVADETKFKGRFLPFLMGALTFVLPCGFTITVQGLALLSGNALQGGLIMFLFALGTTLPLLGIGFSSVKFSAKPNLSGQFLKVAGVLVLFFAAFNINSQLNVLGAPSLSNIALKSDSSTGADKIAIKGLAPIVNGKQILEMKASSTGYSPNNFKVKAGVPVRWEITDTGTSGCTNAVISRNLFDGQIDLTVGQVSVKEFTPTKPGIYKFSCWMGMISGTIEVI
jgi:uncharacterized protein